MCKKHRQYLVEKFKTVDYVSATTDIWSRNNLSFIAVSVHYLDPITFKLETFFIACEHFVGRHTHETIAEKLHGILKSYGILEKTFFVTSDNASSYVSVFQRFGDNYDSFVHRNSDDDHEDERYDDDDENTDSYDSHVGSDDDDYGVYEEDDSHSEGNSSNNVHNDGENYRVSALPLNLFDVCGEQLKHISRIACVCHLMDKVGSKDSEKALTNVEYCEMHNRAFEKLKGIWDMKKSRVCAEKFFEITRKKLIIPHRIRWMKTYDAVSCFAKIIYEFLLLKNIYDLIVDSTHSIN